MSVSWLFRIGLLALAYVVTGSLGLLLAIPPGYATAVWPPSGIALAALLLGGYRLWPGVFLGSFLINTLTTGDFGSAEASLRSLLLATSIGGGATLQAIIGAWLIHRLVGYRNFLTQEVEVVRILLLGGPAACLINSMVGAGGLAATGALPAEEVFFTWFTWWIGDVVGVLIFTPLVCIWALRPSQPWRRRQVLITIPLVAMFALTVQLFTHASARGQDEITRRFDQQTDAYLSDLKSELDNNLLALRSVAALFDSRATITPEEYAAFCARLVPYRPGLLALGWNARVSADTRDAFEARMQAAGVQGFQIRERGADGQSLVRAGSRAEYFPVTYAFPPDLRQQALGFDVASEASRRQAIEHALATGEPSATGVIQMVMDAAPRPAVLVFAPVYRNGPGSSLRGLASAPLRLDELLASLEHRNPLAGLQLRLFDRTTEPEVLLAGSGPLSAPAAGGGALRKTLVLNLGGRSWHAEFTATQAYLTAHRDWSAWALLAGGLTFTGLLGVFLFLIVGRQARVEMLVGQATTAVARLTRIHAVLSSVNALIVRARDRDELFRQTCRTLVEAGGLRSVWIGLLRPDGRCGLVSSYGGDGDFMHQASFTVDPRSARGWGPLGRALNEYKPVAVNDIALYDQQVPWRAQALEKGYRSVLVCPLLQGDKAVGALNLYAAEPGFFDSEEIKLIGELAGNISYAMEFIARKEEIDYLAHFDPLTQLANRALFMDRLSQFIQTAQRDRQQLALLLLDLENFKSVNDSFGMTAGDILLQQVAARLIAAAGSSSFVARVAGDRFAVVIPGLAQEAELSAALVDGVRQQFAQPYEVGGQQTPISARFGVAISPADGGEGPTLFQNAEAALKRAKTASERYMFYAQEMSDALKQRLGMETGLRKALEREEFVLHYQPRVELRGGTVCGAEALMRWNSPEFGLVPPARFIPLLEETGLIVEVGRWVLQRAAADYRRLLAEGQQGLRIAVNVSAAQLRQRDFVDVVHKALAGEGTPLPGLDIEITESMLMSSTEENIAKLHRIRELGLGIAMDDFGTGYSSLSYLARLPLNAMKIDHSFISGMIGSTSTMNIVSTIISLAHSINLQVIAEGVETEEQLRLLRGLRCDEIQGFLFSRPVPLADLVQLLRSGKRLPRS